MAEYIVYIGLIFLVLFTWHYGHTGVWREAAHLYKCKRYKKYNRLTEKGFNYGFAYEGKWKGGFYASLYVNEDSLCFKTPYIVRFLLPNICIEISSIADVQQCNRAILWEQCSEIYINNFKYTIVVPVKVGEKIRQITQINNNEK